jgi:hypothetical protein
MIMETMRLFIASELPLDIKRNYPVYRLRSGTVVWMS